MPGRKSLSNLLLIAPAFAIMGVISVAAIWLLQRWQSLRCPADSYLVASGQGATILQIIPIFIASIGFGFLCANWFAHSIPPLRQFFDRDAQRHDQPGYQNSQRQLLQFSLIILLIMLPISVAASLSQYCLRPPGILNQSWFGTGLQSYSWSDVAKIETTCTRGKGGWHGSYVLITRDGASLDLMTWPGGFARVYPQLARALHGGEFTFDSTGVRRGCDISNIDVLLRRP